MTSKKQTTTEQAIGMIEDQKDYRDAVWKVVEKTGADGALEMHLRTKLRLKWRNKHCVLAVVCKSKPTPGVQLRTTNGTFLLSIANVSLQGMCVELRTAIESSTQVKKQRVAFCGKFNLILSLFFCLFC